MEANTELKVNETYCIVGFEGRVIIESIDAEIVRFTFAYWDNYSKYIAKGTRYTMSYNTFKGSLRAQK